MEKVIKTEDCEKVITANLPRMQFIQSDPRLEEAEEIATRTNQITPLLKEELRIKIIMKRHESGENEIKVKEEPTKPQTFEMTPEELEKKFRRREQNRLAAQRCRRKKREQQEKFWKTFTTMESRRLQLQEEVAALREEKKQLENVLKGHLLSHSLRVGEHETSELSDIPNLSHLHDTQRLSPTGSFSEETMYDLLPPKPGFVELLEPKDADDSPSQTDLPSEDFMCFLNMDTLHYGHNNFPDD